MMVLCILREVRASVVLRLGNLQVVDTSNDGEWRFRRNWLRRNGRDMAILAWALDRKRGMRGYGELMALHQLGYAAKRKNRSEFDVHERYNDIVDGLTHETNDLLPVYASFARDHTSHTALYGTSHSRRRTSAAVPCTKWRVAPTSTPPVPLNGACRSHGCEGRTDLFSLLSRAGLSDAPSRTVPHRSGRRR